jgi:prepilin-type N-terminal cleavage/methylation domain-containing protein
VGCLAEMDRMSRSARPRLAAPRRLADQSGFTLIEVLVAAVIAATGLIAIAGSFDVFRALATHASSKEAATHVAEQELERIRSYGWSKMFLTSTPSTSTDPSDPRSNVDGGPPVTYRPDATRSRDEIPVSNCSGCVSPGPDNWSAEGVQGKIYRFITCGDDDRDETTAGRCSTGKNKRVTVAVTVTSANAPQPVVASTTMTDPEALPPGGQAGINPNPPQSVPNATTTTYYPYDTGPVTSAITSRQNITGDHATHATAAATWGASFPDLMGTAAPPNPFTPPAVPPFYKYSTDVSTSSADYPGGVVVRRSATACSGGDSTRAHLWVTPPFESPQSVDGNAAASLWTQTVAGAASLGKICVTVYRLTLTTTGAVSGTPTTLGSVSFTLARWPSSPQLVSFPFRFLATGTTSPVASGDRIGFRVTVDASGTADLAMLYDHPDYATSFQLETTP